METSPVFVYYHKSKMRNMKNILKKGLLTSMSNYHDGAIFLSTIPGMNMGLGHALFEVRLHLHLLPNHDLQYITHERDIPPHQVRFLGKYGPNKAPAIEFMEGG